MHLLLQSKRITIININEYKIIIHFALLRNSRNTKSGSLTKQNTSKENTYSTPEKSIGSQLRQTINLLRMPLRDNSKSPRDDNVSSTAELWSSHKRQQISPNTPDNPKGEKRQVIYFIISSIRNKLRNNS